MTRPAKSEWGAYWEQGRGIYRKSTACPQAGSGWNPKPSQASHNKPPYLRIGPSVSQPVSWLHHVAKTAYIDSSVEWRSSIGIPKRKAYSSGDSELRQRPPWDVLHPYWDFAGLRSIRPALCCRMVRDDLRLSHLS